MSDSHTKHDQVIVPPNIDILFHCGDWTFRGYKDEVESFAKWLEKQPAKHIVLTGGNHEVTFKRCLEGSETDPSSKTWITDHCPRAHILIHESLELEGIKIFGSPWTPAFAQGWVWNAARTPTDAAHYFQPLLADLWNDIPTDTNVLITHGPPLGILDWALDYSTGRIENAGCRDLARKIETLKDIRIHAFGHLHYCGSKTLRFKKVQFINAAVVNDQYKISNSGVWIDYEPK
jgi:Icc-related predicted phosphoesterase